MFFSSTVTSLTKPRGPIADDARASTGYIVWIDGRSRVLVDTGGGTFLRFGEAGASFVDLDFVGLSHFHTDHSADFPALLKSGNFSGREEPLFVYNQARSRSGEHVFEPGRRVFLSWDETDSVLLTEE